MTQFLQQLINGLSLGSIYALIALGYTMVYGIIKLINFAHGDIYMLGAYIGFICTAQLGMGFFPALAAAMGSLAVQALRSDDEALRQTAEELRQMTDYMVFQIDEELRSREPYDKRRNDPAATRNDLDIALRVASDIPNEVVYIMCRCIELMKEVVDRGDDLTACSALAAVHLSVAAIRCMQAELLSYAKEMDDDVFGYTIVREAELNLANHQELIDGLVEELTRRLTREKK